MIPRRTFAKAAAAGLAMAAAPLRLLGDIGGKLKVGVGTYSYHSLSLEDMIVQWTALRIEEIEMSRGESMRMNTPGDDLFCSARAQLDRAGIRCVSYYSATIKDSQDIENATRFANLLGVRHITGDATPSVLAQIEGRFTQAGLTFGIHHQYFKGEKFPYESPEDVPKAVSGLSKTVGATADVGHFASCGHDPVEAVRKLAPRLHWVHLKDVEAAGGEVNVLLGRGIARIPEVMQELHRQHFAGLVTHGHIHRRSSRVRMACVRRQPQNSRRPGQNHASRFEPQPGLHCPAGPMADPGCGHVRAAGGQSKNRHRPPGVCLGLAFHAGCAPPD